MGKTRIEGKHYVMQDRDVVECRFNGRADARLGLRRPRLRIVLRFGGGFPPIGVYPCKGGGPNDWIYVFDIDTEPGDGGRPAPIRVSLVIGTDAATLSRAAFEVAPARAWPCDS